MSARQRSRSDLPASLRGLHERLAMLAAAMTMFGVFLSGIR